MGYTVVVLNIVIVYVDLDHILALLVAVVESYYWAL